MRFKHRVIPGDTLILKLELLNPIRRGICKMRGTVYVGNKLVTEAELVRLAPMLRSIPSQPSIGMLRLVRVRG